MRSIVIALAAATTTLALKPPDLLATSRRHILAFPIVAVGLPSSSLARSSSEFSLKATGPSADSDLKGMLGSTVKKFDEDAEAAKQKAIDDAKPINEKLADSFASAKESAAKPSSRPKLVVATPRPKKAPVKRSIGDDS